MADDFSDRTEAPTPRRRSEARRQGRVPRSQELTAALMLLGGFIGLMVFGRAVWDSLLRTVHRGLEWSGPLTESDAVAVFAHLTWDAARSATPLLIAVLGIGLLVGFMQVGPLWTWTPLKPSLNKINPLAGLGRMFSARTAVQLLINIAKLLLVGGVIYVTLMGWADRVVYALSLELVALLPLAGDLCFRLGIRIALAMLLLGLIDYAYQRYRHERDLRMTRSEVREELRSMEGDPVLKRRRRQVQMQLALQRIRRDVPKADVVVTNPTHVAVALKYEARTMHAPQVVAKGADYMALRLREVAAMAGVPIVEKPLLARAIYAEVEVGRTIPGKFFQAVAEVLAYVYELSRTTSPPASRRVYPGAPVGAEG